MGKVNQNSGVFRKLKPADWTDSCDVAFLSLKEKLLICAILTHSDFTKPLALSVDASLEVQSVAERSHFYSVD